MLDQYLDQFIALANGMKLTVLIAMVAANFLLGLASSFYHGSFRLKAIADFLVKRVLPYIICYLAVVVIAVVEPSWEAAVTVVWALIIAALVGAIFGNLKEMGIHLPESLAGNKE
ncbi:hypothetical protein ES703_30693 [subsurface metagenome]